LPDRARATAAICCSPPGEVVGGDVACRSFRRGKYSKILSSLQATPWLPSVGARQATEREVVGHRHAGKEATALRHVADAAAARSRARTGRRCFAALELDRAGGRRASRPAQRLQQRRLARAVATEQRHDLAFAHVEASRR
jgi:hypothetical protein